jgi:hypothetical protein
MRTRPTHKPRGRAFGSRQPTALAISGSNAVPQSLAGGNSKKQVYLYPSSKTQKTKSKK